MNISEDVLAIESTDYMRWIMQMIYLYHEP